MKTKINILILILTTGIFLCLNAFPQSDSGQTFYPKDMSIDYPGFNNIYYKSVNKLVQIPEIKNIDKIKSVMFPDDSTMKVTDKKKFSRVLNINNIQEVNFVKGKNTGKGLWIGSLAGASLGFLLGLASGKSEGFMKSSALESGMIGGIVLAIPGALIGFIIGTSTHSYDRYDFTKINYDKKGKLKNIIINIQ